MFYSTRRIDLEISFQSAMWLRVAQSAGLGFLFVPISLIAYVETPQEKGNSVAGMVNFMRNIGSGVGTSMVTTLAGPPGAGASSHAGATYHWRRSQRCGTR